MVPPWETEATRRSAIFLHKTLFSSFSTGSATITHRSCHTAGFQQRPLLSPQFAHKQSWNWMVSASWSGILAPHSLLQIWSHEQWTMVTHWLPVASVLHVVWEWGRGHGPGTGTGYFGFLPFLSGAEQEPEHPQGYSLSAVGGICPSGAVLSLRIEGASSRGRGRERCADVPLTPSHTANSLLLTKQQLRATPCIFSASATLGATARVLAPGHGLSDLSVASGSKYPVSQSASSSSVSQRGSKLRGGLVTRG